MSPRKNVAEANAPWELRDRTKLKSRPVSLPHALPLSDAVLRLIWREHRVSRAEIARYFELSRSTVTEMVKGLLRTGFVKEVGRGESTGGRRPVVLEFQDQAAFVLGVDIGATHVSVALTDLGGKIKAWKTEEYPARSDPVGTLDLVTAICDGFLSDRRLGHRRLLSLGVGVPSPVDPASPGVLSSVLFPEWQDSNAFQRLGDHFGVPLHVDNDANLGALAEHWWGAGADLNDFVYFKLARGIGAGIILGGDLYRGAGGQAGEFGHLPVDPHGERCICGLRGCLTTITGGSALERKATAMLPDYPQSVLADASPKLREIEDAAIAGDGLALGVIDEAAAILGRAIAGWSNILNPEAVILGGSLARVEEILAKPIRDELERCSLTDRPSGVDVRLSELGERATAIGAATLALERSFSEAGFYRGRVT